MNGREYALISARRPKWFLYLLRSAFLFAIGIPLISGFFIYRSDIHLRQALRVLLYEMKTWWVPKGLLLVGDSRVFALNCDDGMSAWNVLNLGVPGLTAQQLRADLQRWLGESTRFERAVIWIGVNDVLHHQRSPQQAADDINGSVGMLFRHAPRVAVFEQIPMLGNGSEVKQVNQTLVNLQLTLDAHRLNAPRAEVGEILRLWSMEALDVSGIMYSDSIHLNSEGNQLVCERLAAWLATP